MKNRTRVIAIIFILMSVSSLVGAMMLTPGVMQSVLHAGGRSVDLRLYLTNVVIGLEWPIWTALLRRKAWAWKVLVILYSGWVVERIWTLATAPAYYAAHPKLEHTGLMFAATLLWALIGTGIPLWALITDRPSGWSQPANPHSEIPSPQ